MDEGLFTVARVVQIETVGSTYLVASGLPAENPNHAEDMIRFLFLLQELCKDLDGEAVPLKIGVSHCLVVAAAQTLFFNVSFGWVLQVNSGPIAAGIIGLARCFYRVFGSTVNIASRMMSHGVQDHIHLSPTTAELLRGMESKGKLLLEPREPINVKGRGMMTTYFAKEITSPTPLVPKTSSVNVNSLRRYLKGQVSSRVAGCWSTKQLPPTCCSLPNALPGKRRIRAVGFVNTNYFQV